MMKQEIQPAEGGWTDVESNTKMVSDDEALLNSLGKVGELKRYGFVLYLSTNILTVVGSTISGLVRRPVI